MTRDIGETWRKQVENRADNLCEDAEIISLTEIGQVTIRIFKFNDFERVLERQGLIELGLWRVR